MEIPILLEPADGTGFRATTFMPIHLVGEGETRADAIGHLRSQLKNRLAGAEIATMLLPLDSVNPLLKLAGTWSNHPDAEAFEQSIREYRQQVNADPNRP